MNEGRDLSYMIKFENNTKENIGVKSEGYVSNPNVIYDGIEHYLFNIFETEKGASRPVILDYKPIVIKKIAGYLTGRIKTPATIGIAGETASGKSTITKDVINTVNMFADEFGIEDAIVKISTDDYYRDRSEDVKRLGSFAELAKTYDTDVPEALELDLLKSHIKKLISGQETYLPKYMMDGSAIRYDNHTLAKPSKVIVTEGLFAHTENIRDIFDFKIYVDIPIDIQKERFYKRAIERDLGDSTDLMYKNASDKADIYVRPCKNNADIVISGYAGMDKYKVFLNKFIGLVQEIYFS